jgi:hypothetical protein
MDMLTNTNNYKGKISVTFNQEDIRKICTRYIPDFKEERFEIIALRFFSGKENILTIYAVDKFSESSILPEGKIPVRKFKIELSSIGELMELIAAYNFTLCNEAYSLGEMEVMNR